MTHPSFPSPGDLELRVLDGTQAGARAALTAGVMCTLAAGTGAGPADIVLREPQGEPARVRLTAGGGKALLEVLEGQVQLGTQTLEAGARVAWAMHAPLRMGGAVVAYGPASLLDWPDGPAEEGLHDVAPDSLDTAPAATDLQDDAPTRPLRPPRRRTPWLVPVGLLVALSSVGALAVSHVVLGPQDPTAQAPSPTLAEALRGSEFANLTAARGGHGDWELRGRLATLAEHARLDAWLAARQFSPVVQVQVDEGIARDVTDVFRVNGVAVQARVQGAGHIVVDASETDPQRLARAEEIVRRDVRGMERLTLHNRAAPPPPPAPPVITDPGKRIASLVPGDPGYLVTADGARYFVGAMLPTGHRITQIAAQRVTLERDGQTTQLNL
jgi:type III secretion protein D